MENTANYKISVVATVLNEGQAIEHLLKSLATQTRMPDEVVIVDGGSTDGTLETLQEWGGSEDRLEDDWLESLVAPFETEDSDHFVAVVAGWFEADPQSLFETAMGATVLPSLREVKPEQFLPSSRSVAFRRAAWEAIGGYPEWLDYCEDLVFDLRLREFYGPAAFAPEAKVYFRPRSSLWAFFKQYYRYARGDGKADLWRKRHAIRYLTYWVAGPLLVALALLHSPWWWLALAVERREGSPTASPT